MDASSRRVARLEAMAAARMTRGRQVVSVSATSEAEESLVLAAAQAEHPGADVIVRRIVRPGFPGWPSLAAEHARRSSPAAAIRSTQI